MGMDEETVCTPLISVIMGVYNCANTLREALECIVAQTYEHWELVICDDGSTDDTYELARAFAEEHPHQTILIRNACNMGLNHTLNRCLAVANGEFIARMDGDDLCSPDRFEKEIRTLLDNPSMAIVSTNMLLFDEQGVWGRTNVKEFPEPEDFIHTTQFCHAACMVRHEAFVAVHGYTESSKLLRVEDYHLWIKMYELGYRGMNIQDALYQMRDDRNAQSRKKFRYRLNEAHVKALAIRRFHLPFYNYVYCLKPIAIGLLPGKIYRWYHRRKAGAE